MLKEFFKNKYMHFHDAFGQNYYRDPIMLGMIVIAGLEAIAMILLLLFTVRSSNLLIPIGYNSIYGVVSLGSWLELYSLMAGIIGFLFINLIIAWSFFDKERLISYLLGFCNLVLGSLGLIVLVNLIILGGR